jgi:hypothetical protein
LPYKRTGRGTPCGAQIDVNDHDAMEYWCAQLSIAPAELRYLVESVGPSVDAVKVELMSISTAPWFFRRARHARKSGA